LGNPRKKNGRLKQARTVFKVEVSWVDATSHTGWFEVDEALDKQPVLMHTVGYILERNKKFLKIVRSVEDSGFAIGDPFIIPTDWIRKIKRLK
jgi:hypothetical protein